MGGRSIEWFDCSKCGKLFEDAAMLWEDADPVCRDCETVPDELDGLFTEVNFPVQSNKENRPLVPESWSKEIKDQLSVDNITDVFGVSTEMVAHKKEKKMSKRKIYKSLSNYAFRLYLWLEKKYLHERDKLWNQEINNVVAGLPEGYDEFIDYSKKINDKDYWAEQRKEYWQEHYKDNPNPPEWAK